MLPVLISVGPLTLSSFGFFLALSLITAVFFIWRLSKIEEMDEDQTTNLTILTFVFGLVGARIAGVLMNPITFTDLSRVFNLNQYPALSFWGGLIGGILTIIIYCKLKKIELWKILDLALIGALIAIIIGNIGCFLGGCGYGITSESSWALPVAGQIGKRLPISAIESVILFFVFLHLWKKAIRFHIDGSIIARGLILVGIVKYFTEFYRGDRIHLTQGWSLGQLLPFLMVLSGLIIIYTQLKRDITRDVKSFYQLFSSTKKRQLALLQLKKSWYNQKVVWRLRAQKVIKSIARQSSRLKRRLNVTPTPREY